MKIVTIIFRLLVGIIIPTVLAIILVFLFQRINIYNLVLLQWFPLMLAFVGFYLAGLFNRKTKLLLLPVLLIGLAGFIFFPAIYFPFNLLVALFAIIGLLITRSEISTKIKIPLGVVSLLVFGYYLFSQPLVIENSPGVDTKGELIDKKVIWDFGSGKLQSLPNETFIDAEGNRVQLSDFEGKDVYVSFWATWCGPCIANKPKVTEVQQKYSNRSDLIFIDVSIDKDKDQWMNYITENQSDRIQLISTNEKKTRHNFQFDAIPKYVLIDKAGHFKNAPFPRFMDDFLVKNENFEEYFRLE